MNFGVNSLAVVAASPTPIEICFFIIIFSLLYYCPEKTRCNFLQRERLLQQGVSFCFETVFSHVSKIDFVANAKAQGYEIVLVYIHLDTSELNEARVYQRVTEGGHSVPVDKIHSRIPRTMKHIGAVLPLVDEARLLDNYKR